MIRLSKQADYGILLLTIMTREGPEQTWPTRDLAAAAGLSSPIVAKVLKLLARAQLLDSTRGATGGYCLAFPPDMIAVSQIISALDGPISITECADHDSECSCDQEPTCITRHHWILINDAIQGALRGITLADMAKVVQIPNNLVPIIERDDDTAGR